MRKHPGIWFTLWAMETLFLITFLIVVWDKFYDIRYRYFLFIWGSMCFFYMTYFHGKWIENSVEENYKKDKERENIDYNKRLFIPGIKRETL